MQALNGLESNIWTLYLPEIELAIEYQGAQHFRPIDFFGGQEGYEKTRKRDIAKRGKCTRSKVQLIEIQEGYEIESLFNLIERRIKEKKGSTQHSVKNALKRILHKPLCTI